MSRGAAKKKKSKYYTFTSFKNMSVTQKHLRSMNTEQIKVFIKCFFLPSRYLGPKTYDIILSLSFAATTEVYFDQENQRY